MVLRLESTTMDAAACVFNTPELLEDILRYIPERQLRSQAPLVCRGFRDMVRTSLVLRRKLFLVPDWKRTKVHFTEAKQAQKVQFFVRQSKKYTTHDKCACAPSCAPRLGIYDEEPFQAFSSAWKAQGFRELLLSQPPVTRLFVSESHYCGDHDRWWETLTPVAQDPQGLKFGHLLDHLGKDRDYNPIDYVGYWDCEGGLKGR